MEKAQPLLILTLVCVVGSATSVALAFVPSSAMAAFATRLTMMQF